MKKISFVIIILSFFATNIFAQNKIGKISGTVTAPDGRAINAATVSLLRARDSVLMKTQFSDKQGLYEFEKVAEGNYIIQITAVGFVKQYSSSFTITADAPVVNIPALNMVAKTGNLQEVNVVAKRPFVENRIDKTIVNVDASPTSNGLTALEMLEKSPGVTVDNDGNISIKGKSGVIVMIDGKPAYLSGQDLANYLRNLSANQLDQIEIMTQPSARFDASGNSGMINFKTKKNKANGFNGSFNTTSIFANYYKNTNAFNFNWRKNKFNVFGNYSYSTWVGFNEIDITRSFRADVKTNSNRYMNQHTYGKFKGYPHSFKLGTDFTASNKVTLGAVFSGSVDDRRFNSSGVSNIYDSMHNFVQYNTSESGTHDPWTNIGANLNFRYATPAFGELTADADYILYRTKGNQYSNNFLYNANGTLVEDPYLLNGYLPAEIDIYSFKSDFSKSYKDGLKLEAGLKSSLVKTDNDAQYTYYDAPTKTWLTDNGRSNHFLYQENINAAYLNFQKQIKKWGFQLGLRMEQTISKGHQVINNSDFEKNYTKLFPTAFVSYKPTESNTLSLSYGRRIERPGYQDLNPFQYLLDRYTFRQGNPLLQPQFSNNIELGYNYKGVLNISANYTVTDAIINDVIKTEKSGDNYNTFQTKENIASRENMGISISFNKPMKKWWTLNLFTNINNNHFKGFVNFEKVDVSILSYNANMSNQFTLGKGWSTELSAFYNSKNLVSSVILAKPMGMFSIGVGKQILKNKGTIRFNARDPFWLMKFRGNTTMDKFVTDIQSRWDNRRFIVAFTFRFGKMTGGGQQKRRSSAEEEQQRANTNTNQ